MKIEKQSPCKVNLLLNVLGKRADGFHELETIMHPVAVFDTVVLEPATRGIVLTCNEPSLPTDSRNLVFRAASHFFEVSRLNKGVRIHLEKRLPLAAGLGGGSGNAACTLLGLNELFDFPLGVEELSSIAASIGSDVPFFLQARPALGTGRGEKIRPLEFFPALRGAAFLLVHPGFGIATPWAYQQLARYPEALNGRPGRAKQFIDRLQAVDLSAAASEFYNSLEAPALEKYPILALFQEFLRANGATATLMSGSGSTTWALVPSLDGAHALEAQFKARFGEANWLVVVPVEAANKADTGG